jgi:predicted protein tyrosine phosphatase
LSSLHVCPLSRVTTVLAQSGAGWAISALALANRVPDFGTMPTDRRLHLAVSDIAEPTPDYVLAQRSHLAELFTFLQRWDRETPLLIHCYAGVSRSTAIAFTALCLLAPEIAEAEHADRIRAASTTATPNPRIVALADDMLGRQGRMIAAIAAMGRGADCFEGVPFDLPIPAPSSSDTALDASLPQPA